MSLHGWFVVFVVRARWALSLFTSSFPVCFLHVMAAGCKLCHGCLLLLLVQLCWTESMNRGSTCTCSAASRSRSKTCAAHGCPCFVFCGCVLSLLCWCHAGCGCQVFECWSDIALSCPGKLIRVFVSSFTDVCDPEAQQVVKRNTNVHVKQNDS